MHRNQRNKIMSKCSNLKSKHCHLLCSPKTNQSKHLHILYWPHSETIIHKCLNSHLHEDNNIYLTQLYRYILPVKHFQQQNNMLNCGVFVITFTSRKVLEKKLKYIIYDLKTTLRMLSVIFIFTVYRNHTSVNLSTKTVKSSFIHTVGITFSWA
jgi:Ulp1 family protease